jgi:hypothetical protein
MRESAQRQKQIPKSGPMRPAPAGGTGPEPQVETHPLLRLQQTLGNRAVSRLLRSREGLGRPLQRKEEGGVPAQTPAPAPPAPTDKAPAPADKPAAAEKTPLELAKDLVAETPAAAADRAAWILRAAEQGFVTFNTDKARQNLEDIKDKKKVEHLDPAAKDYEVPVLDVEVGLVKKVIQRWITAEGKGGKPTLQLGSMVRSSAADVHGKGKAIDINNLDMTSSVGATVQILEDLEPSSYGLGFPFQGDFFDPADEIKAKQAAAQAAAAKDAKTATVTDAVVKFASHTYKSTGTKADDGTWKWTDPTIQEAAGAYKRLRSKELKDTLAARRKAGLSFVIFPDNDNHLHLDTR